MGSMLEIEETNIAVLVRCLIAEVPFKTKLASAHALRHSHVLE
jgi:hypothetical protein